MGLITIFLQLIIAFGLLNVWLIRSNKQTEYRGSNASSLKNEFAVYGLPVWFFYLIGFLKIGSALLLLIGFWIPSVIFPVALLVSALMLGAISMHLKVNDPWKKLLPASIMLLLSLTLSFITFNNP